MAITDFFGKIMPLSSWSRYVYTEAHLVDGAVYGSSANDMISVRGDYLLAGGTGDDQYAKVTNGTVIVEEENGGIDTVSVIFNYAMPEHVENLVIGYANGVIGNSGANYILGNAMSQSIDGGAGNDVLTGGGGGDSFVFETGSGYDVITDFRTGPSLTLTGNPDTVRLTGYASFLNFEQVRGAMTQIGNDVVLTLSGTDAIRFDNTKIADFTADNFLLHFDPGQLTLTFQEEFNSLSLWDGAASGVWRTDYGWGNDRNGLLARTLPAGGERQIYVDPWMTGAGTKPVGINPFSIDNGVLNIHADNTPTELLGSLYNYQFTSGMLSTRNSFVQTYGYFEARMKIPDGQGAWPAFWLYTVSGNGSELDVLESHGNDLWTATTHDYATGSDTVQSSAIYVKDLADDFHTYGVLWTAETVTWYMDGVAVKSIRTPADMHGPMYMLVNLALDSSTSSSFDSADLQVDYIRAYSLPASGTKAPGDGYRSLYGTAGNDSYIVYNSQDAILGDTGGTDGVTAYANYVLPAGIENLTLLGTATVGTGNGLANLLRGNDLANTLSGYGGNDTLIGGAGADTMLGGAGNDYYCVDNAGDRTVEQAGEGKDTVASTVDWSLAANVENLVLAGSAVRGYGNELDNYITGNALANTILGGAGNDILDGGAGADIMLGGTGNDSYHVDDARDLVIENADEGWDIVWTTVDLTAAAHIEQLVLSGGAVRGTANSTGTIIVGNAVANILTGGAGADRLDGKDGDDRLAGGGGNDILTGGLGNDVFVFAKGGGNDRIVDFELGSDRLDFGAIAYANVHAAAAGVDTVLSYDGGTVTLAGVRLSDFLDHHVFV